MKSRGSWLLALFLACVAAGAATWGYQEHREHLSAVAASSVAAQRLQLAQADNERLQGVITKQNKDLDAAYETAQRKAIEQAVVGIRGLNFQKPVEYETLSHADITKILQAKLSEHYSDEDFKHFASSLAALGLLEPNYPLKEKYISLLGEQIAAFYDQHQHKLFMFENATLHNVQNRVVLAHELTHALQDQHFGLMLIPLEVKNNDDLSLATSALVEGDATQVMFDYETKTMSLQTFTDTLAGALSQDMQQYSRAPRFLRETLVFPYTHGKEFCQVLYSRGGYEAISQAFRHPPSSSTQILHPEKYFAGEEPIRIDWPDITVAGKKPTDDNVLGEFGTRLLFEKYMDATSADYAAEGWRGDRYIVFDDGKGLVWKTLWEDDERSQNFREALLRYVGKRFKQSVIDASNPDSTLFSAPGSPASAGSPAVPPHTGEILNAKSGNGVIFIWGETKEMNDQLVEKFKE